MLRVPQRQRRLLDRRRGGDAGIGDQDVDAAELDRRVGEAGDDDLVPW